MNHIKLRYKKKNKVYTFLLNIIHFKKINNRKISPCTNYSQLVITLEVYLEDIIQHMQRAENKTVGITTMIITWVSVMKKKLSTKETIYSFIKENNELINLISKLLNQIVFIEIVKNVIYDLSSTNKIWNKFLNQRFTCHLIGCELPKQFLLYLTHRTWSFPHKKLL